MLNELFIVKEHNGYVSLMNHLTGEMFYRKVDKKNHVMLKNKKVSLETFSNLTNSMETLNDLETKCGFKAPETKNKFFPLELIHEEQGIHVYLDEGLLQASGMPFKDGEAHLTDVSSLKYHFKETASGSIRMSDKEEDVQVFFATSNIGGFWVDLGTNVFYTNGKNAEVFIHMKKEEFISFLIRHAMEVSTENIVEFHLYQRPAGYYIHLTEVGKPFETTKKMFLERQQNNFDLKLPISLQEMELEKNRNSEKKKERAVEKNTGNDSEEEFVCPF